MAPSTLDNPPKATGYVFPNGSPLAQTNMDPTAASLGQAACAVFEAYLSNFVNSETFKCAVQAAAEEIVAKATSALKEEIWQDMVDNYVRDEQLDMFVTEQLDEHLSKFKHTRRRKSSTE
ncbi:hypothetical protein LIA77_07146 [Sarocladium implicatum]|nr:hypothetical protein LIA77_07146 [Sarocladium implicatum]